MIRASRAQRLVYGGHTIGLALAQATRLLPNLVTVLGWQSCDHTGPVHEGDTLYSELQRRGGRRRCPTAAAACCSCGRWSTPLGPDPTATARCWTGGSPALQF